MSNRCSILAIYTGVAAFGLLPAVAAYADTTPDKGKLAAKELAGKLLTLDYVNAEVTDVIRALSAQSGVNVAVSPSVKGQVTVHLRGKTIDEALAMVANLAGLGARKVNDTYVVAAHADMRPTLEHLGATSQLQLEHMTAQAAVDMAQAGFPDLTARPQGKAVVLVGANEDLDSAAALIHQNDVFNADDVHTVLTVRVKHMDPAAASVALAKMEPGLAAEPAGNSVVLAGSKRQVEAGERGLALLDVQGRPDMVTEVYNIKYAKASQLIALVQRAVHDVDVFPGMESTTLPDPQFNPLTSNFAGFNTSSSGGSSSSSSSNNSS